MNLRPPDPQSGALPPALHPEMRFCFSKNYYVLHNKKVVEVTGLEPAASASRTQRSTKLSHTSKYMPHHQYNIKIIYYYILNVKRNFRLPCFVFARQSCGLFYSSRILFSLSVATKASMSFRAVAESISYSESVLSTISSTVVSF